MVTEIDDSADVPQTENKLKKARKCSDTHISSSSNSSNKNSFNVKKIESIINSNSNSNTSVISKHCDIRIDYINYYRSGQQQVLHETIVALEEILNSDDATDDDNDDCD